jgi:hypothetical protein
MFFPFLPPLFSLPPQQRHRWPPLLCCPRPAPTPAPLHASPGSSATASVPPRCPFPRVPCRYPSRQQLLAVDRRAVHLAIEHHLFKLKVRLLRPSFARPLTLFFFSWTQRRRRRRAPLPPLRAAVDSLPRPFSSYTSTSSSFALIL